MLLTNKDIYKYAQLATAIYVDLSNLNDLGATALKDQAKSLKKH